MMAESEEGNIEKWAKEMYMNPNSCLHPELDQEEEEEQWGSSLALGLAGRALE